MLVVKCENNIITNKLASYVTPMPIKIMKQSYS